MHEACISPFDKQVETHAGVDTIKSGGPDSATVCKSKAEDAMSAPPNSVSILTILIISIPIIHIVKVDNLPYPQLTCRSRAARPSTGPCITRGEKRPRNEPKEETKALSVKRRKGLKLEAV